MKLLRLAHGFRRSSAFRWAASMGIFLAANAEAQQVLLERAYDKQGETRLEIESVFTPRQSRGFMPVRVTIRNATAQNRKWDLDFDFQSSWGQMGYSSRFTVAVDSGSEVIQELLVPVPTGLDSGAGYRQVSVRAGSAGLPSAQRTDSTQIFIDWPAIGISQKLADRNLNQLNSAMTSSSHSRGGVDAFAGTFDPEKLPADWRGYTGLDVLMIADEEWERLSPGARMAILEWTRLGGRLDFYVRQVDTGAWLASHELIPDENTQSAPNRGLGSVRAWNWDGQNLKAKEIVSRYAAVSNLAKELSDFYRRGWSLLQMFDGTGFNTALVILLLIAFGIIVGPINLFVLAKPGQRHKLFITTPIISLVASLLILAIILLSDGIGGSGRRLVLALLESGPQEKRLYITQKQVCRTGVLLGSGFRIDDPVFLSPIILPPSALNRIDPSSAETTDYRLEGGTYRGDWFQSRSEQAQFLQSVRATRSRVEQQAPATDTEAPRLFSSLEFEVDEFFYRDGWGFVWKYSGAASLAGGEAIPLQPSDEKILEKWWEEKCLDLNEPVQKQTRKLWRENGRFFATSSDRRAGFVETLGSIRWKDDLAIISGSVVTASTPSAPEGTK
ncbi:MAG: hypothetical protein KDN19_07000 [Verrucomicrobiae bacterium]|nr:hypothetical protein [Verrucomicrobiae bacterium]